MSGDSSSRKTDPSIIAALIGVTGTIIVTLITVFANRAPAPQPTVAPATQVAFTEAPTHTVVPTDTVPPGEPTSTPEPPTETPVPTATTIPAVPVGEDWSAGCISTAWKAYPAEVPLVEKGDGCWKEPVHIFSAENGDLDFLTERGNGGVDIYGLFAPLPESGTASFMIQLKSLENVDLLIGVFDQADVVNGKGLLLTIPHEKLNKLRFVQKDNVISYSTLQGTGTLDQGSGFSLTFTFSPTSVSATLNPNVFVVKPIALSSSEKWLFLGYKGLPGAYRLEGRFFSLSLK